jgi:hypothetical protein
MRIAKPLLLIATPIGLVGGLREAWRFNPGLAFLMFAMVAVVGVAVGSVVAVVRRERRGQQGTCQPAERSER